MDVILFLLLIVLGGYFFSCDFVFDLLFFGTKLTPEELKCLREEVEKNIADKLSHLNSKDINPNLKVHNKNIIMRDILNSYLRLTPYYLSHPDHVLVIGQDMNGL